MRAGIVILVLAYGLSQFYRAFLAVLSPYLATDLGVTPAELSYASGVWFIVFAAMQIPVGALLDRVGPRWTATLLFALGGAGGAVLFGSATASWQITAAMALIGVGCSPVLMASYYIFARLYSPAIFATLAGAVLGLGSLGNIASAVPLVWAVEALGWRGTMFALAAATLLIAVLIGLTVQDPPKATHDERGSVLDLLKIRALWPVLAIMTVSYAPAAAVRGVWAGPFAADVFGADANTIGTITLVMGLAMIAGSFLYGPLDRWFGTRKWVILPGNVIAGLSCGVLALWPEQSIVSFTVLITALGLFGASFPAVISHGRSMVPAHLTGRGVTLLNLFGIGGVGISQFVTGRMFAATGGTGAQDYASVFLFFAVATLLGCALYLFAKDTTD